MKNSEFQKLLQQHPDDMPIKLMFNHNLSSENKPSDLHEENILLTSVTAYVDEDAPEDECDCEDGKIMLGDGERYLLINPIII